MNYNANEFKNQIYDADRILIGLGMEFDSLEHSEIKNEILEAYNNLALLIRNKDYFIVTLCYDDLIYKSKCDPDRIVAPCGSIGRLQCVDNCSQDVYGLMDYEHKICPQCGKPLVENTIRTDQYNESGYLPQWKKYTEWLQKLMNKKSVLLELGVGMRYPRIIRFPFEKVAMYQQKSVLYRVNESISQIPEELSDKAYELHRSSVNFCRNEFV